MRNLIKKIALPAALVTGLSTATLPAAASAPATWSRTYYCREYAVTLHQYQDKSFSYHSRSKYGNLNLGQGTVKYTEGVRVIKFRNANTQYWVWDGTLDSPNLGTLEVYQNNRLILQRQCHR
jgi:hypothetical protein